MQGMQMRMKFPLNYDTCYAQHFAKMNSQCCQASEVELLVKIAATTKRSTLSI